MNTIEMQPKSLTRYGVLIFIGILIAINWLPITDHIADADIDAGFTRALTVFGIAKAINMIVSVFQSSQIGLFGVTLTAGEVLDPINDLVEQFSNVMLLATVAFGIQKILVAIGGHLAVKTAITITAIIVGILTFTGKDTPRWVINFLIILALTRLAVPVATIGSNAAYKIFLDEIYQTSSASLNNSVAQLEALVTTNQLNNAVAQPQAAQQPATEGWWSRTKSAVASVTSFNPNDALSKTYEEFNARKLKVQQLGEQMTRDITNQIVVFLLQTLIFPIGLIWALYKLAISLTQRPKA